VRRQWGRRCAARARGLSAWRGANCQRVSPLHLWRVTSSLDSGRARASAPRACRRDQCYLYRNSQPCKMRWQMIAGATMNTSELNADTVARLVESEIQRFSAPQRASLVRKLLIAPRCELRPWDYGEQEVKYPCWIIAEHRPSNTAIAYCAVGFGPSAPWGILWLEGGPQSMGEDSGWFPTLEEAVMDSCAANELDRR